MSQQEKARYFNALKDAGVEFTKHYREYKTDELKAAYDKLLESQPAPAEQPDSDPEAEAAWQAMMSGRAREESKAQHPSAAERTVPQPRTPPRAERDPNEMAGQRLNTQPEDEPIRVDELGRAWFQEEVLKPAFPKPRGRRVLTYIDSGTEQRTLVTGRSANGADIVETFEVSGTGPGRTAEVKVTLPSYQVGIYKDRRFPFRVHTYNGREGFDLFEVQNYYGGSELVPQEIKRIYVENVLCYDIRTTVRAIQSEYRQLQLAGKVQ